MAGLTAAKKKRLYYLDGPVLYGERARNSEVWQFSPYEFVTHWHPALTSFPQSLHDADRLEHHVKSTTLGHQKLRMQEMHNEAAAREPGVDYVIKEV